LKLVSAPKLNVSAWESPHYRVMGNRLTDGLFILGHAPTVEDGGEMQLNVPYGVSSIQEAIDDLQADIDSPLLIAMLEAYFSGARDIWLVPVAPMSDLPRDEDGVIIPTEERNIDYFRNYRDRLNVAYDALLDWDINQITVPIGAPFNDYVISPEVTEDRPDFLGPLVNYCVNAFDRTGEIHLGIIGTLGIIDQEMIDLMLDDGRLGALGEAGKFVSVFAGEGTFHFKELPFNHTSSVAVAVAGEMSRLPLDRGLTYRRLTKVINVKGQDLSYAQINSLAEKGINTVARNYKGRRGQVFQVMPFTDNTLAETGSDYWSLVQMRIASVVSAEIRAIGNRSLGTIGYGIFRSEVEEYMMSLARNDVVRQYTLDIQRDPGDHGRVLVDVSITPYFGVREINVSVSVGPSLV